MTRRRRIIWIAVALALVAGTLAWLALRSPQPAGVVVRFAGYTNPGAAGEWAMFTVTNYGDAPAINLVFPFLETESGTRLAVSHGYPSSNARLLSRGAEIIFMARLSTQERWRIGVICLGSDWRRKIAFWIDRRNVPLLRRMVPTKWYRPPSFTVFSDWVQPTNGPASKR